MLMPDPDRRFLSPQDLEAIQGLVIYGTHLPLLRYHFFEVKNADAARGFIGAFVSGGDLQVSSAAARAAGNRIDAGHRIYVALTSLGLQALEEPGESLKSFPEEFRQGATARASGVGDTGASAPEHWTLPHDSLHIAVMLYARTCEELEDHSKIILTRADSQGCSYVAHLDGEALKDFVHPSGQTVDRPVHFNFRDGISQPSLMGARPDRPLDAQAGPPPVPPGMFVLGHPFRPEDPLTEPNFSIANEPVPEPEALGYNGTFGALRVLEQDCDAFEDFLDRNSDRADPLSRELLAAKMCGRWRNGRPLALFPDDPGSVSAPEDRERLNDFDYRTTTRRPNAINDPKGALCPIGSHVRRANPRSADVLGQAANRVRLIRRGMTYGPPHVRGDGKKRGILGLFLCASLKHQFEFVQKHWINDGLFAKGLAPGDKDPLVGNHADPARFAYPNGNGETEATGLTQFVKTTGAAYLFFPSLPALRFLSTVKSPTRERSRIPGAELEISIQDRVDSVVANMLARLGRGTRRDAHPKHHGVVRASFEILSDLPHDLAHGLFSTHDRFHAYIRFSNGSPKPMPDGSLQPDRIPDARGMAIKLLGVPGRKLLDDEERTHDFVLASHPVFFTRDLGAYLGFLDTQPQDLERRFPLLFASFKTYKNPLTIKYFSQTPYRLGPEQVVKYVVEPVAHPAEQEPLVLSPLDPRNGQANFLRDAMATHLTAHEAVFDFKVQRRPQTANVDDATEEWGTEHQAVARITISVQEFNTVRQDTFAENMSFSPWHCLEAHEPLGSINLARRAVYQQASAARHRHGGILPREPDGTNDF